MNKTSGKKRTLDTMTKLNLDKYHTIQEYLSRNVDALQIPAKLPNEDDFPPFILDGASGVGKTQQAFALLKKEKHLVLLRRNGPGVR